MGAAAYLTCVPADYFMAFLGDRVGRKPALLFVSSVAVVSTHTQTDLLCYPRPQG